jgi:hypothetical protein
MQSLSLGRMKLGWMLSNQLGEGSTGVEARGDSEVDGGSVDRRWQNLQDGYGEG